MPTRRPFPDHDHIGAAGRIGVIFFGPPLAHTGTIIRSPSNRFDAFMAYMKPKGFT